MDVGPDVDGIPDRMGKGEAVVAVVAVVASAAQVEPAG